MTDITWTGADGTNDLTDPLNWSTGTVPGNSDNAIFNNWSSNVQPDLPSVFVGTLNVASVTNNNTNTVTFSQPITVGSWDQANGGSVYMPYNSAIGDLNSGNGTVGFTIPAGADATSCNTYIGSVETSGSGNVIFSAIPVISKDLNTSGGGTVTAQNGMIVKGNIDINGGTALNVYGDLVISNPIDGSNGNKDGELGKVTGNIVVVDSSGNKSTYTSYDDAVDGGAIINAPGNPYWRPQGFTMDGSNQAACYGPDTLIEMFDGSVKFVNELEVGDRVHTGAWITWVGCATVNTTQNRPIEFQSSLGRLIVSPEHLMVYMGKFVQDRHRAGGKPVMVDKMTYWHFQCNEHTLVRANGMLSESFLNVDGPRGLETVKGNLTHGYTHEDLVLPLLETF